MSDPTTDPTVESLTADVDARDATIESLRLDLAEVGHREGMADIPGTWSWDTDTLSWDVQHAGGTATIRMKPLAGMSTQVFPADKARAEASGDIGYLGHARHWGDVRERARYAVSLLEEYAIPPKVTP